MSKHKPTLFRGVGTALVTPFLHGEVDYNSLGQLIDFQVNNNADAIIIAGTTGESSTLSYAEKIEIFKFSHKKVDGRIPLIFGTGSNNTEASVELTREACDIGCDGLLVLTPYYNRASNAGLVRHFSTIADNSNKPIIMYNVPSRTSCNIPIEVYRELMTHERIVGIKEASGNLSAIAKIADECGDHYDIYSGNDDQTLPILSLGGAGVISVASNLIPRQMHTLCRRWFDGDVQGAAEFQLHYLRLMNTLFCEVNPIPVKCACKLLGICSDEMRLPLCPATAEKEEQIAEMLKYYKLMT